MIKWVKKILAIVLAVTILSVSINFFLAPHHIAAGGLTGLAIILETLIGWNRSTVVFIFNIAILVITLIFLGKKIFLNTVIGALLLPFLMGVIPSKAILQGVMLSVLFGSVLFGVGVSILFSNEASSGGTSIPPLILKKYFGMNPSIGLFITDSIIVLLSVYVFGIESFFYAIFSIFLTSITMSYLETGLNKKKTIFIISDEKEAILHDILHDVQKGATIVPVKGGYGRQDKEMLMVTLNARDYKQAINIINKYDEKAFVITYNVSDVHGLGFTYQTGSI